MYRVILAGRLNMVNRNKGQKTLDQSTVSNYDGINNLTVFRIKFMDCFVFSYQ